MSRSDFLKRVSSSGTGIGTVYNFSLKNQLKVISLLFNWCFNGL